MSSGRKPTARKLLSDALTLEPAARERLAFDILYSLIPDESNIVEVLDRRAADVRAGREPTIPLSELRRELLARAREKRAR